MPITNKTKLVKVNTSRSLRATISDHIIPQMDLQEGDQIEWILKAKGDKFIIDLNFHKE